MDVQETALQIRTYSTVGSGERMWVRFADENGKGYGIDIRFNDPPTYDVGYCQEKDKHFTIPTGSQQVWTVRKSTKKVNLLCNDVEIFDYEFSKSTRVGTCVQYWSTCAIKFQFDKEDTAGKEYRSNPNYGK